MQSSRLLELGYQTQSPVFRPKECLKLRKALDFMLSSAKELHISKDFSYSNCCNNGCNVWDCIYIQQQTKEENTYLAAKYAFTIQ
jgi:hypothetical protein